MHCKPFSIQCAHAMLTILRINICVHKLLSARARSHLAHRKILRPSTRPDQFVLNRRDADYSHFASKFIESFR